MSAREAGDGDFPNERESDAASLSGRSALVIGPGWLGSAIVDALLSAGADVWTMRRSAPADPHRAIPVDSMGASAGAGANAEHHARRHDLAGDVRSAATNPSLLALLPSRLDHVVLCIAPSRERGDTHESSYPASVQGAVAIARMTGARSVLYTSSTGVYGRTDGSIVRDDAPVQASDARQQALVDAERLLLGMVRAVSEAAPSEGVAHATVSTPGAVVLRVAGLYGPGRDPARRFADPSILDDGGETWSNFAWRDDVASAVLHLLGDPRYHRGAHVFNCADGHPMQARDIAEALGVERRLKSLPPSSAVASIGMTSRGVARSNQRIMVDALLATGWSPQMPSVLHGLERLGHRITYPDARPRAQDSLTSA